MNAIVDPRASIIDPQITMRRINIRTLEGELTRVRSKLTGAEWELRAAERRNEELSDENTELRRRCAALWLAVGGMFAFIIAAAIWRPM